MFHLGPRRTGTVHGRDDCCRWSEVNRMGMARDPRASWRHRCGSRRRRRHGAWRAAAAIGTPWPPSRRASRDAGSRPFSGGGAAHLFHAARLPARTGRERPLIQDPIAIDWDPAGRLWAIELPGTCAISGRPASTAHRPHRRARGLERRRRHGPAHGVRRRPDPAPGDEGPRAGRARGRAPEHLADADTMAISGATGKTLSPPATGAGRPTSR